MPIISNADTKSVKGKLVVISIYVLLLIGGFTMIYPFMVTITGSMSTPFDYERRSPFPRFIFSKSDRFMRTLCAYFPSDMRNSIPQMRSYFPSLPLDWRVWKQIGDEEITSDKWAASQTADLNNPEKLGYFENMAADYHGFVEKIPLDETVVALDVRFYAPFLRNRYKKVEKLNAAWEISVDDFTQVGTDWKSIPFDQQSFLPENDVRYTDLLAFTDEYRENIYTPFLNSYPDAVNYVRPAALAFVWELYVQKKLNVKDYEKLHKLPFPVPASAGVELRKLWLEFLADRFPLRHIGITPTEKLKVKFEKFISERFKNIKYLNKLMKADSPDFKGYGSWRDMPLSATVPKGLPGKIWMDFVLTKVSPEKYMIMDTLPEKAFQQFVMKKYGSLEKIDAAYGIKLDCIENLRIPFRGAFLATFNKLQWKFAFHQIIDNFISVLEYMFYRGRAVGNTIILIALTLLLTLTVNPLAGYALSRFRLKHTHKVLVFCLATMSFPASITAIPGFLLLRDLSLLNTFAALVLPTAANGMSIFLLKGFFDSLPTELYEAATIDGATEIQIFYQISLPLVKPILAVSMLNAFIAAYNGWAWAIIVCQDKRMWTIAVWTYQFSQLFAKQPYMVMAAYLICSLPVFLVFLFCQKIIMRGIILPQMK